MKKFITLFALLLMVAIFSADAMGMQPGRRHHQRHHQRPHHTNNNTGSVGAPLDGGLLTVLGAAGVAYVVSRKKKKATEE